MHIEPVSYTLCLSYIVILDYSLYYLVQSLCFCQAPVPASVLLLLLHLAAQFRVMAGEHLQPFVFHQIVNEFCSDADHSITGK